MIVFHHERMGTRTEGLTGDWNTAEAESRLNVEHVLNDVRGRQHDRFSDEAVFMSFDSADHSRLRLGGLIVVDDADTPQQLRRLNQRWHTAYD